MCFIFFLSFFKVTARAAGRGISYLVWIGVTVIFAGECGSVTHRTEQCPLPPPSLFKHLKSWRDTYSRDVTLSRVTYLSTRHTYKTNLGAFSKLFKHDVFCTVYIYIAKFYTYRLLTVVQPNCYFSDLSQSSGGKSGNLAVQRLARY